MTQPPIAGVTYPSGVVIVEGDPYLIKVRRYHGRSTAVVSVPSRSRWRKRLNYLYIGTLWPLVEFGDDATAAVIKEALTYVPLDQWYEVVYL